MPDATHANAALTPRPRLRIARLVVEDEWTYSQAAKMFMYPVYRCQELWLVRTASGRQERLAQCLKWIGSTTQGVGLGNLHSIALAD